MSACSVRCAAQAEGGLRSDASVDAGVFLFSRLPPGEEATRHGHNHNPNEAAVEFSRLQRAGKLPVLRVALPTNTSPGGIQAGKKVEW